MARLSQPFLASAEVRASSHSLTHTPSSMLSATAGPADGVWPQVCRAEGQGPGGEALPTQVGRAAERLPLLVRAHQRRWVGRCSMGVLSSILTEEMSGAAWPGPDWYRAPFPVSCRDMTEQLCVTYGFGPPGILPTASITKDLADFEDLLGKGCCFHTRSPLHSRRISVESSPQSCHDVFGAQLRYENDCRQEASGSSV